MPPPERFVGLKKINVARMREQYTSKRIINFKKDLIKIIPRIPNDRQTLNKIEQLSLTEILIIYLNWITRLIPPRNRMVIIEPPLKLDAKWGILSSNIEYLFEKVKTSKDLIPHLSLKSYKEGYCPFAKKEDGSCDRWADKDFLLNIMGYHHFHLGIEYEDAGHIKRTDDVLFAEVTKETFTAIGFFNHSVFESNRESIGLTKEKGFGRYLMNEVLEDYRLEVFICHLILQCRDIK
jgi:hypothetical protein